MEVSRLTRDWTAEPVSRDQFLRRERGQGNVHFPCSADHEQDWQRGRERERGGNGAGTGTGTGTGVGTRRRTPDGNGNGGGNGDGSEDSSGDGNVDEGNGTGTRIGSGRAEERRNSAKKRKIGVDAMRETGKTRVEREKNVEKKGLVQ